MAKWDPDYWFLDRTNADLDARIDDWTNSYGYVDPGFDLDQPYSSGNQVRALVDGESYMGDLLKELKALQPGDFLFITGWEFSETRFLDKNDRDNTLLPHLLRNLVRKQVTVGLIAFNNVIPTLGPGDFIYAVNQAQGGVAVADGTTLGTSHHEKVVFVGGSAFRQSCAYVGGIDLAVDRHDSSKHDRAAKEKRQWGWHDIQLKVAGKAVMQIWANFADRWNSIHGVYARPAARFACPVPPWAKNASAGMLWTQHVQVLRTVGKASPRKETRYMRDGEGTIRSALLKAIRKAEHYIYMEEQFLWDGLLATELYKALSAKQGLHLIIVLAARTDMPSSFGAHHFHLRSNFFQTVLHVPANQIAFGIAKRVHPYGLYRSVAPRKAIYVHSKLMIIDDRYVAVGSANVNERSMYIDTELTLGVVDGNTIPHWNKPGEQIGRFAKDLREQLWKEHSGVSRMNADPIQALAESFPPYCFNANDLNTAWPTTEQASEQQQQGHLRCWVNQAGKPMTSPTLQKTLDRTTRTLEHN